MTIRAEFLVSLGAAHGIDLERAAKLASKDKPKADVVPGKRKGSRVLIPPTENRVHGTETRTMLRPQWTVAEIGQAAVNLPEEPFRAALYAFAGAHEHLWYLHRALMGRGRMFALMNGWPLIIRDFHGIKGPYLAHLARLVLDEDVFPVYFRAAPALYGIYMRVTPEVWDSQLKQRYEELKWAWTDWLGYAARMIQSKLSEHEE